MMAQTLPSLYEYYTTGEILTGLSVNQPYFTLNNRNITIYSGSVHYFRVPRPYWRDRLRKLRAAGLNTVDTYVPWNLHEPQPGQYDFGNGSSDFKDFLNITEFLTIAQEEDLFVIVRPGPYICSEWEFGGFPSWLLKVANIMLRTSQEAYMSRVRRYFSVLLPILAMLQFTRGGPIIAFQVENEYSSINLGDKKYMRQLRDLMHSHGIVELLLTSDGLSGYGYDGTLPGEIFITANLGYNPGKEFEALERIQPDKPIMVMEFWIGWFSHWGEDRTTVPWKAACKIYEKMIEYNASINIYMFHGGTNFGFMNGANLHDSDYTPDITSYDYDAPLTERGEYTQKYRKIKQLLEKYNPIKTRTPKLPEIKPAVAFSSIEIAGMLPFSDIVNSSRSLSSINILPMEKLYINDNAGQSYGYIVYRKTQLRVLAGSILTIEGHVRDTVMVLLNGVLISKSLNDVSDMDGFGYWKLKDSSLILGNEDLENATLDLIVENWGRVNYGDLNYYKQYKGLLEGVYLDDIHLSTWKVFPLEFRSAWTRNLWNWKSFDGSTLGPALYQAFLYVEEPVDTFIDMSMWTKGIVIVNGFVLGRYVKIGPQQTLYLPAPLLEKGRNTIVVFEHFIPSNGIVFSQKHIFGRATRSVIPKSQNGHAGVNSYWKVGIVIFMVNNIAMVVLYIAFRKKVRKISFWFNKVQ